MNDKFDEQKDFLLSIKREINLLQRQVDYLIRNEQPLSLLDLDVMMNRIHTLYDMMCGVNLESEELEVGSEELGVKREECDHNDEEELPVGLDEIRSLFGIEEEKAGEEEEKIEDEMDEMEDEDEDFLDGEEQPKQTDEASDEEVEENEDAYFVEEVEDMDPEHPEGPINPINPINPIEPKEPSDNPAQLPGVQTSETQQSNSESEETINDFSFILNFEPMEPEEASPKEPEKESPKEPEKTEEETPKDPQPIEEHPEEENLETDSREEPKIPKEPQPDAPQPHEPHEPPEPQPVEPKPIYSPGDQIEIIIPTETEVPYQPMMLGDMEDTDDNGFELETPETVGERYQQNQEETVGEKLQHSSVKDLQGAIGVNDKFLFVNELFGGSMERYNRSIENLNDLKTLNGALIYLNELRVELQWNSSNEAYKKLLELVHRKFEA